MDDVKKAAQAIAAHAQNISRAGLPHDSEFAVSEYEAVLLAALAAPRPSGEPAPGSPLPLEHWRTCSAGWDDADCTCGLSWRIRLATEQEMHNAWRKRAEEAEAREAARDAAPSTAYMSGQERMRSRVCDVLAEAHPDVARLVAKLPLHGQDLYDEKIGEQLRRSAEAVKPLTDRLLESERVTPDVMNFRMGTRDEAAPASGSPLPLEHWRSCAALTPGEDCTCSLNWRIRLATEQEMHNAWRKRAEEAEAREQAAPSLVALWTDWRRWDARCEDEDHGATAYTNMTTALDRLRAWTPAAPSAAPEVVPGDGPDWWQRKCDEEDDRNGIAAPDVETLRAELAAARAALVELLETARPAFPRTPFADAKAKARAVLAGSAPTPEAQS